MKMFFVLMLGFLQSPVYANEFGFCDDLLRPLPEASDKVRVDVVEGVKAVRQQERVNQPAGYYSLHSQMLFGMSLDEHLYISAAIDWSHRWLIGYRWTQGMKHAKDAMAEDFADKSKSLQFPDIIHVATTTYTIAAAKKIIDDYIARLRIEGVDDSYLGLILREKRKSSFWRFFANSPRASHKSAVISYFFQSIKKLSKEKSYVGIAGSDLGQPDLRSDLEQMAAALVAYRGNRRIISSANATPGKVPGEGALDLDSVIAAASEPESELDRDRVLTDFAYSNMENLTADELLQLAEVVLANSTRDDLLTNFASAQAARLSLEEIVKLADNASKGGIRKKILADYVDSQREMLSAEEVIELALATENHASQDAILMKYARSRAEDLSVKEVIEVAEATQYGGPQDAILVEYARSRAEALSVADVIEVAEATQYGGPQDAILMEYARSRAEALSVEDVIQVAKATINSGPQDAILMEYARSRAEALSVADVIEIASEAQGDEVGDDILFDFGQSQADRIRVAGLNELLDASVDGERLGDLIDQR